MPEKQNFPTLFLLALLSIKSMDTYASETEQTNVPVASETVSEDWKETLKNILKEQLAVIEKNQSSRAMAIVRTRIEEAVMWLEKEIYVS